MGRLGEAVLGGVKDQALIQQEFSGKGRAKKACHQDVGVYNQLRNRRGLTRAALARKMRVKRSFIAKLESAEAKQYDLHMLAELAIALNSKLEVKFRPRRVKVA